jgi:hypothetical protein
MYFSKKHKLLFIAVPRTASNSVQRALVNSEIADETDIVRSLSSPIDFNNIRDYHMMPSVLVETGVISADELNESRAFAFVREPFERWVSSIFLARFTKVLDPKEDAFTQICNLVRGKSQMPFAGRMFVGQRVERPFSYEQFFYYNENKVVEAYRFEDVEAATNKILSETLGKTVSINLPNIQMNQNGTPREFRRPAETWLPSDCYEKMKLYFANDTAFYNSVKPLNE